MSQDDPISSNLFTATIREVFEHFQREGINVSEKPSDLRLADGVALATESIRKVSKAWKSTEHREWRKLNGWSKSPFKKKHIHDKYWHSR